MKTPHSHNAPAVIRILGNILWLLYVCFLMMYLLAVLCWHQGRIWVRRSAARADASY